MVLCSIHLSANIHKLVFLELGLSITPGSGPAYCTGTVLELDPGCVERRASLVDTCGGLDIS